MKKWILAIICLFYASFSFGRLDGQPEVTVIDKKFFFKLTSVDEFMWYVKQLSQKSDAINAVLEIDIDFAEEFDADSLNDIFPSDRKLSGVFDGQGHTLYNYRSTAVEDAPLFKLIDTSGVVKNLNMVHVGVVDYRPGGIASVNKGLIENCHVEGYVDATHNNDVVGGIVAINAEKGTIRNSSTDVRATSRSYGANVGGIAGCNWGKIQRCFANISLDGGSHSAKVGGISGTNTGLIEMCHTEGIVRSSSHSTKAGGLVGINSGYVLDNYSSALVIMESWGNSAGGIAARNEVQTKSSGVIMNNYIIAPRLNAFALVDTNKSTLQNSYYDATILKPYWSAKDVYPAVNKDFDGPSWYYSFSTSQMQSDWFAWTLNTQRGNAENSGRWSRYGGYPIFADSTHLPIQRIIFVGDKLIREQLSSYTGETTIPDSVDVPEGKTFLGWYTKDGVRVTANSHLFEGDTVYAKYGEETDMKWLVCYYNSDMLKTKLGCDSVGTGEAAAYKGETPTLEKTIGYTYTFKGWNLPEKIFMDRMAYALYDSTLNVYTVKICNSPDTAKCNVEQVNAFDSVWVKYGSSTSLYVTYGEWYDQNQNEISMPRNRYVKVISDTVLYQKYELRESSSSSEEAKSSSSSVQAKSSSSSSVEKKSSSSSSVEKAKSSSSSSEKHNAIISLTRAHMELSVNSVSRSILVTGAPMGSSYAIFDMQGRVLQKGRVASENFNIAVPWVGGYIVRVGKQTWRIDLK